MRQLLLVLVMLLLKLLKVVDAAASIVLIFHRCPLVVVRRGQRCEILTHLEDAFDGKVTLGKQFGCRTAGAGTIEGGIEMSLLLLLKELVVREVVIEAGGGIWRFTATRGRGGRRTRTSTFPFDGLGQEVERTGGTALCTNLGKKCCGRII